MQPLLYSPKYLLVCQLFQRADPIFATLHVTGDTPQVDYKHHIQSSNTCICALSPLPLPKQIFSLPFWWKIHHQKYLFVLSESRNQVFELLSFAISWANRTSLHNSSLLALCSACSTPKKHSNTLSTGLRSSHACAWLSLHILRLYGLSSPGSGAWGGIASSRRITGRGQEKYCQSWV